MSFMIKNEKISISKSYRYDLTDTKSEIYKKSDHILIYKTCIVSNGN